MTLIDQMLTDLPDGRVEDVSIGLHWTAAVINVDGERRCGLASTLKNDDHTHGEYDVPEAGRLTARSGLELAAFARSETPILRSIGYAALNALLPRQPARWTDVNASEVIAEHGAGREVAMIGHFPFVGSLRERVGALHVLELNPLPGDLPASAAPDVLPKADVVAITGLTLLNDTFEGLVSLCAPEATVLVLGPTTPLHDALFERGATLISGAIVEDVDAVLRTIRQGANFRQTKKAGVRLVTMGQIQG